MGTCTTTRPQTTFQTITTPNSKRNLPTTELLDSTYQHSAAAAKPRIAPPTAHRGVSTPLGYAPISHYRQPPSLPSTVPKMKETRDTRRHHSKLRNSHTFSYHSHNFSSEMPSGLTIRDETHRIPRPMIPLFFCQFLSLSDMVLAPRKNPVYRQPSGFFLL